MLYEVTTAALGCSMLVWGLAKAAHHTPVALLARMAHSPPPTARQAGYSTPLTDRLAMVGVIVLAVWVTCASIQALFPVTSRMTADVVSRTPGGVVLQIVGTKTRPCRRLTTTAYAIDASGKAHKAELTWPHDIAPGSSRPVGFQSFGMWSITWGIELEPIIAVRVESEHSCAAIWPTVTTPSGPFHIPRAADAEVE